MNKEPKKKYITDREEPSFDIRNISPEIIDDIQIIGNPIGIINEEQFDYLRRKSKIAEVGYEGQVSYIRLQNLFTMEDIKNKIEEICKEQE